MATTIKLKSGSGAPLAGDLVAAEPAFDLTNKRLYTEDSGGTVIEVGTNPTSLTTGTFTSTGIDDNATSTAITIDSSENVGIGTTTPSDKLTVVDANTSVTDARGNVYIRTSDAAGADKGASLVLGGNYISTTSEVGFGGIAGRFTGSGVNGYLSFSTLGSGAYAERMRIDSSGNLLVGTTSPSNVTGTGVKLFPEGYGGASTAVGIVGASSTSANSGFRMYSTGASAYRFYVDYAGTIFATSTSISAISDASLKENVRDLDKGLDTINALQPRRFDWKNGDGNDIMGFIAQEVEEVMPELVHEYKYSDEENKKGLKMGDMVPSIVKAIQELSAQVNELKAEVAALKGA